MEGSTTVPTAHLTDGYIYFFNVPFTRISSEKQISQIIYFQCRDIIIELFILVVIDESTLFEFWFNFFTCYTIVI